MLPHRSRCRQQPPTGIERISEEGIPSRWGQAPRGSAPAVFNLGLTTFGRRPGGSATASPAGPGRTVNEKNGRHPKVPAVLRSGFSVARLSPNRDSPDIRRPGPYGCCWHLWNGPMTAVPCRAKADPFHHPSNPDVPVFPLLPRDNQRGRKVGCGRGIRTPDLQVMSLASYRTAPPRVHGRHQTVPAFQSGPPVLRPAAPWSRGGSNP